LKIKTLKSMVDAAISNHPKHSPNQPIVLAKVKANATIPDFWHGCAVRIMGGKDLMVAFNANELRTAIAYADTSIGIWWLEE
jgi:hypothetical protein